MFRRSYLLVLTLALASCSVDVRGRHGLGDPAGSLGEGTGSTGAFDESDTHTDACPGDPDKRQPGSCGCGVADADADDDGSADCLDGCPSDLAKVEPGECGCGNVDTDADGDGRADCLDGCPEDASKSEPGRCGCNVLDNACVADGTDQCPDTRKEAPGVCGCARPDDDMDGDGAADCIDGCPAEAAKREPGACGCRVPDTDADGDGVVDCRDGCPDDARKDEPGVCGCGIADAIAGADAVGACANLPPHVAFLFPKSPKVKKGQLGVEVEAGDRDGIIVGVSLYINGKHIRRESVAPYQWGTRHQSLQRELADYGAGEYRLEVVADDNAGATARASMDISITD